MKPRRPSFLCLAALLLSAVSHTHAHTWVEELSVIGSNGTFVGAPGYPRGFIQRSAPTFADFNLINQIPPNGRPTGTEILPTDLMCRQSQFIGNQTAGNPRLSAAPGDNVALVYAENGHVTLLQNSPTKPVGSGTVFVYGTKQPSNGDTYLGIHRVWNTAGTGGDKRGKLLATRPFDDGLCFQDNSSPLAAARRKEFKHTNNEVKCQSDVQLPQDASTSGLYTLYYVWEWPTLSPTGKVVTNESYTTCMDINMIAKSQVNNAVESFDTNQPIDSAGVQAQISSQFLINPTQPPQLTTTTVVGAAKSSQAAHSAATSSKQASGFVTVTVTAPGVVVTVTNTVEVVAASAQSKSLTIIPEPPTTHPAPAAPVSTSSGSSSTQSSSYSVKLPQTTSRVVPSFIGSSKTAAQSQQATSITTFKTTSSATTTLFRTSLRTSSAAASTDKPASPAVTSVTSSSKTSTGPTVAPAQETAITYLNGTLHNGPAKKQPREYIVRGRRVVS